MNENINASVNNEYFSNKALPSTCPVFGCFDDNLRSLEEDEFALLSEYLFDNTDHQIFEDEFDKAASSVEYKPCVQLPPAPIFHSYAKVEAPESNPPEKRQRTDQYSYKDPTIEIMKREKNRALARKTRQRKKLFFETLQKQVSMLSREREMLRDIVKTKIGEDKNVLAGLSIYETPKIVSKSLEEATSVVGKNDYALLTAIQTAQRSFCITNPTVPDNPIIYVSEGFLKLTGYKAHEVIGRNCRFLQGPGTDQRQIAALRKGIAAGADTSVCLLNYRADGTTFYNQIFVAALRNKDNAIVNYVGVQVEVHGNAPQTTGGAVVAPVLASEVAGETSCP